MKMMFPATRMNRSFGDLASDMNQLVDTLFGAATGTQNETTTAFTPRMDIHETDEKFVVSLDLPGVKSDDVSIDLTEEDLVIHGKRTSGVEAREDRYYRVERWFGDFKRSIRLPRSVDRENIAAEFNDGVLNVWLPKCKAASARKIQIRSAEVSTPAPVADSNVSTDSIES
jgi:HSP20 family protein